MAKQTIDYVAGSPNTLPEGGAIINANFLELYTALGSGTVLFFGIAGPTAARTFTLPDADATIATLAGVQAFTNKTVRLTAAHGTDDTLTGATITGLNAAATIAQWEAVYLGGSSTWLLADANGSGTYPARGLAVAAYSNTNAAEILVQGTVRNDAWAWTPGGAIYLSATPGALTQTPPATSGDQVQQVGFALTADIAYFDFNSTYVTVA